MDFSLINFCYMAYFTLILTILAAHRHRYHCRLQSLLIMILTILVLNWSFHLTTLIALFYYILNLISLHYKLIIIVIGSFRQLTYVSLQLNLRPKLYHWRSTLVMYSRLRFEYLSLAFVTKTWYKLSQFDYLLASDLWLFEIFPH